MMEGGCIGRRCQGRGYLGGQRWTGDWWGMGVYRWSMRGGRRRGLVGEDGTRDGLGDGI